MLDALRWMDGAGLHLWDEEDVRWEGLCKRYALQDFCIAYKDGQPAACMALSDSDALWPDVPKGESLFLHKIAVKRAFAGQGLTDALIGFAKCVAHARGIHALRLDCAADRAKLRALYERNGFSCVHEKLLFGKYHTVFFLCKL